MKWIILLAAVLAAFIAFKSCSSNVPPSLVFSGLPMKIDKTIHTVDRTQMTYAPADKNPEHQGIMAVITRLDKLNMPLEKVNQEFITSLQERGSVTAFKMGSSPFDNCFPSTNATPAVALFSTFKKSDKATYQIIFQKTFNNTEGKSGHDLCMDDPQIFDKINEMTSVL